MQKVLVIFLMVAMMCVSVSGYCDLSPTEPPITKAEVEKDTDIHNTETGIGDRANEMYYSEDDVVMVAKVLWSECRGVPSKTQKACVAWTIVNRADEFGQTISEVITAPNQFIYFKSNPVADELYAIAQDVLERWNDEKNGNEDVGRVLPSDYLWFSGNGWRNFFRNAYKGKYSIWDYSLPSPYES